MNENLLGSAVVYQAVKDYRWARKVLKKLPKSNKSRVHNRRLEAEQMLRDCEEFFKGDTFYIYTRLDGKALLEKLEQEEDAPKLIHADFHTWDN